MRWTSMSPIGVVLQYNYAYFPDWVLEVHRKYWEFHGKIMSTSMATPKSDILQSGAHKNATVYFLFILSWNIFWIFCLKYWFFLSVEIPRSVNLHLVTSLLGITWKLRSSVDSIPQIWSPNGVVINAINLTLCQFVNRKRNLWLEAINTGKEVGYLL